MQNFTFRIPSLYFLLLFLILNTSARAQFRGGIDDGSSLAFSSNQPFGQNIFVGGIDDGQTVAFSSNQPFGQNIFIGGIDDGTTFAFSSNQPFGQNIFVGGIDDGFTFSLASNQPFGQNIFIGGLDDGFTSSLASNQPFGQNIFLGGADDGWAFAMGSNLVLLPVVLRSFDASWKNDEDVLTRWITSSEANTATFEIQRSINGTNFETVGSVPAAGNSTVERTYTFTDVNVNSHYSSYPPQFYYRLKTVDQDGRISYSAIVVLQNKNTTITESFIVYPNPAEQYITLEFKTTAASFKPRTMQLFTSDGKLLLQKTLINFKQTLQVGSYPSGTYYLKIMEPESKATQTLKFIIQH